ncbi:MAG: hypothetical protein FJ368_00455 [Pelagibacterales bacterium]|nr:hypothetical protein [Pelagibacterales bacterium]
MLDISHASLLFELLYSKVDGYSVSHDARKAVNLESNSDLLYGELPFITCNGIFKRANAKPDGVLIDLGSGTGRVIISALLLCDFKKVVGVELLKGLHDKACEIKEHFENTVSHQIEDHLENRTIELLNKNMFDVDLSEADLVFMNHPFKDRELFKMIEQKLAKELKPKAKIVTIIRALEHNRLKVVDEAKYDFSWGQSTAFFHEVK